MIAVQRIIPQQRDIASATLFWNVVRACLIELYALKATDADLAMERLRERFGTPEYLASASSELTIFHSQPIHVAADVAGAGQIRPELWDRYQAILKRYVDPAEEIGTVDVGGVAVRLKKREYVRFDPKGQAAPRAKKIPVPSNESAGAMTAKARTAQAAVSTRSS